MPDSIRSDAGVWRSWLRMAWPVRCGRFIPHLTEIPFSRFRLRGVQSRISMDLRCLGERQPTAWLEQWLVVSGRRSDWAISLHGANAMLLRGAIGKCARRMGAGAWA